MTLADKIVVMRDGAVEQIRAPLERRLFAQTRQQCGKGGAVALRVRRGAARPLLSRAPEELPFGTGTPGDDYVTIQWADHLSAHRGMYEVNFNGKVTFLTPSELEATKFELGAGNDVIVCGDTVWADVTAYDGSGNDWMQGGAGNDHLFGGAGDDYINGQFGNNVLSGGDGNDKVQGDGTLFGGKGNDELRAWWGQTDVLYGGDGDDLLVGTTSKNVDPTWADGGSGNNTIIKCQEF